MLKCDTCEINAICLQAFTNRLFSNTPEACREYGCFRSHRFVQDYLEPVVKNKSIKNLFDKYDIYETEDGINITGHSLSDDKMIDISGDVIRVNGQNLALILGANAQQKEVLYCMGQIKNILARTRLRQSNSPERCPKMQTITPIICENCGSAIRYPSKERGWVHVFPKIPCMPWRCITFRDDIAIPTKTT